MKAWLCCRPGNGGSPLGIWLCRSQAWISFGPQAPNEAALRSCACAQARSCGFALVRLRDCWHMYARIIARVHSCDRA